MAKGAILVEYLNKEGELQKAICYHSEQRENFSKYGKVYSLGEILPYAESVTYNDIKKELSDCQNYYLRT